MENLTYIAAISTWWTGTVNIQYSLSYDAGKNQTTVIFAESNHAYYGRNGYGSSASTALTVTATDNTSSMATATFATSGATNGSTKTFTGTPSPVSVTVQHAAGAGEKAVTISGETTIMVYPTSTATNMYTATGSGSASVTSATAYILALTQGTGIAALTAEISSSSLRAAGTSVASGGMIYKSEEIKLKYTASPGYRNAACMVSDIGAVASGGTFSVIGNHTATATAIAMGGTVVVSGQKKTVAIYTRVGGQIKQLGVATKIDGKVKMLT